MNGRRRLRERSFETGGSILMTSAPRTAKSCVAEGAAATVLQSMMRMPENGSWASVPTMLEKLSENLKGHYKAVAIAIDHDQLKPSSGIQLL